MDRVTISVSFRTEDLKRFDAWREPRRQPRGSAIMSLLDLVEKRPAWDTPEQMEAELPQLRTPEQREAALQLLRPKLETLPDVKGIHESNSGMEPKKTSSNDWDEFNQDPDK